MIFHPDRKSWLWLVVLSLALILGGCSSSSRPLYEDGGDGDGGDGDGGQPECTVDSDCEDQNICTDDACVDGACVNTFNSVPCDDEQDCSTDDHCENGMCIGDSGCDDGNPCTTDNCDDVLGSCVHYDNSAPCDDGDPCTLDDVCASGACQAGTLKDCSSHDDQCNTGVCDGDTGDCAQEPSVNGTLCDDGQACSTNDHCSNGVCIGDSQMNCDDDNICTEDSCDDTLGCVHAYNQAPCDDANVCTDNDTCFQGICAGDLLDCDDGNPCTTDACDDQAGCVNINNTDPCEDGDDCTVGDTCQDGNCVPGGARNCDDSEVCTDDSCVQGLGCVNANNTDPCDDGNDCTDGDYCQNGACQSGTGLDCDDGNDCTNDLCNTTNGCYYEFNTDVCDDSDACTMNDVCADGNCAGVPLDADGDTYIVVGCPNGDDCNDSDDTINPGVFEGPAGSGICDDAIDNDCDGETDLSDATCGQCNSDPDCDDNNVCNGAETCVGNNCQAGTSLDCNDDEPCTDDTCDAASGCDNTPDDTNTCTDNDPCTVGDACSGGTCQPGAGTLTCEDFEDCTDDACVAGNGCVYTPDDTNACDDGDPCTVGDSCSSGTCQAGAGTLDCDDSEPCTDDTCIAGTGCDNTPDDSNTCDDQSLCTSGDHCVNGNCVGSTVVCDDGNPCTDNDCIPATGCDFPPNDANSCNDGNTCTDNDRCFDGNCVGDIRDRDTDTYGDELCGGDDCEDLDPDINPGAPETCGDGIDNDCDEGTDEGCSGCSAVDPNAELVIDNNFPNSGLLLDQGNEALNMYFVESTSYNVIEVKAAFYDFSGGSGGGQGRFSARIYSVNEETGLPDQLLGSSPAEDVTNVWPNWHTFTLSSIVPLIQGQVFWVAVHLEEDQRTNQFLPMLDGGVLNPYIYGVGYFEYQSVLDYYFLGVNWHIRVDGCTEGPWLTMTDHSSTPSVVPADGSASVDTTLLNRGITDTAEVLGTLSCDDPEITVTADSASYGTINQGNSASNSPNYSVSADANAFGIYGMRVDSTDGMNSWIDGFGLYVQGNGCTTDNHTIVTDTGPFAVIPPSARDEMGNYFIVDSTSYTLTSVEVHFYRTDGPPSADFRLKIYTYRAGKPDQLIYTSSWNPVSGTDEIIINFNLPTPLTFHEGNTFWAMVESRRNLDGNNFGVLVDRAGDWLNGIWWKDGDSAYEPLYIYGAGDPPEGLGSFLVRPHGCQATELRYLTHTTNPANVNPGGSADITVTIANDGAIDATNVTATLSSNDPDVTVVAGTETANYGTVPASGTAASQTPYQVQVDAAADEYQYVLPLSITDGVNTWDEYVPLRLAGGYVDLEVSEFTTTLVGNDIHYHIVVTNNGNVDCITRFRVGLYQDLENPPVPGQQGYLVDEPAFLGLGESVTYDNVRFNNLPSGTYDSYVQVDTEEVVTESDENNNVAGPASNTVGTTNVFELLDPERKWFPQDMPVPYRFVSGNSQPGLTQAAARTAVINGFQHWQDVPTASITFTQDPDTSSQGFVYDTHNTMTFNDPTSELGGGALAACMSYSTTAQTMYTNGVTFNRITDADIIFNNINNFCTNAEAALPSCSNCFDIEGVATHEIGHLLGLDHPPVQDATMYYSIGPCDATKVTLEESDVNGVTFIYP